MGVGGQGRIKSLFSRGELVYLTPPALTECALLNEYGITLSAAPIRLLYIHSSCIRACITPTLM